MSHDRYVISEGFFDSPQHDLLRKGQERRWEIAERLDEVPTACWSDLCNWAAFGLTVEEDEDGDPTPNFWPDTSGGAACAMSAAAIGSCYCGKFRRGREVTDGRS
ncbi:hypothetical protein [Streptomyces sp. NPDC055990]|uniref:hypothetical protein n=1 Tax=Streptomyces sp. NPDC055990 TaxID=3345672 RepID=UPI0035D9FFFE